MNELYQEIIKKHHNNPVGLNRNFTPTHYGEGYNSFCGDEISVQLALDEDLNLVDIGFSHDSCAICTASASLMCQFISTENYQGLLAYVKLIKNELTDTETETETETETDPRLKMPLHPTNRLFRQKVIAPLRPVKKYPSRINCALLPWQTLEKALDSLQIIEQPLTEKADLL